MDDNELKRLIRWRFRTESACAEALGWTKQKLNRITTGAVMPNIRTAAELAKALNADEGEVCEMILQAQRSRKRKEDEHGRQKRGGYV